MKRLVVSLTILVWVVLVAVGGWVIAHIIGTVILFVLAILLAFALYPAVKYLQHIIPYMSRAIAIIIIYLIGFSALGALVYMLVRVAIDQVISLAGYVQSLLTARGPTPFTPLVKTLTRFGISQEQVRAAGQQLVSQLQGVAGSTIPLVSSLIAVPLNILVVATLSIYLLLDGGRISNWLRYNTPEPQRTKINTFLDIIKQVIGSYIRGQLLLATTIALLTGIGMAVLRVPYALLLGVLAFILEFVPMVGAVLTGVICVAVALTQGWLIALLVLGYVVFLQTLEGQILAPRMLGGSIGLHPIVSLLALLAGSELFGITGALFAAPAAGVLQALLVALWTNWQMHHPERFPQEDNETEKRDPP
jgi:predicted PurR-regulated permease PerM